MKVKVLFSGAMTEMEIEEPVHVMRWTNTEFSLKMAPVGGVMEHKEL